MTPDDTNKIAPRTIFLTTLSEQPTATNIDWLTQEMKELVPFVEEGTVQAINAATASKEIELLKHQKGPEYSVVGKAAFSNTYIVQTEAWLEMLGYKFIQWCGKKLAGRRRTKKARKHWTIAHFLVEQDISPATWKTWLGQYPNFKFLVTEGMYFLGAYRECGAIEYDFEWQMIKLTQHLYDPDFEEALRFHQSLKDGDLSSKKSDNTTVVFGALKP